MILTICDDLDISPVMNFRLEYKYSKLIENRDGKDGELPAADSCGLDEGEDDEQFDTVAFKESKGKAFFKKIKIMAKKVRSICMSCICFLLCKIRFWVDIIDCLKCFYWLFLLSNSALCLHSLCC